MTVVILMGVAFYLDYTFYISREDTQTSASDEDDVSQKSQSQLCPALLLLSQEIFF